jgi:polyhydroxyalkanoate synthesis repressor PhaR
VRRKQTKAMADLNEAVTIKRYGGSRFYHCRVGRYLTVGDLAAMVEGEEEFVVHDAQTGEDITRSVLKSIIIEQARHG